MNRNSKAYRTAVMIEHRVFGVAFLVLLLFFGWFTQAVFNKQFTDFVEVDLLAAKSGLQLPAGADVKIRGVIVGEVRDRDVTPEGATLTLGLFPDQLDTIPSNVSARLLPKTLFGEKYVALQMPEQPSSSAIGSDDVIEQTEVAIEVEKVLNDIYPLLRAVQPAEINYTLTAIATALEGRGEDIGNNLSVLNDYLERTNPQIPALVEDLRLLSEVSDVYRSVMPDLARMLRNSATTGKTFVEKEQKIQALFNDMAGVAATSKDFLERNGENIIRLAELGKPDDVLAVLLQEVLARRGEAGHVVEQRLDLLLLLHKGLPGRRAVAQHPGQIGHHRAVDIGNFAQQAKILDQCRYLRIRAREVVGEHREIVPDVLAAALERGSHRRERVVDLRRLHSTQQRVDVVEDLLDLDGHLGLVDHVARCNCARVRVFWDLEGDVLLTKQRLWQDAGARVRRDRACLVRLDRQLEHGTLAVRLDLADLADDHPADLDVGECGQLQPDARGFQRHWHKVDELLGEDRVGGPDEEDEQDQEDYAEHSVAPGGHDGLGAHRSATSVPRAIGPKSNEVRSGTSLAGTPRTGAAIAFTSCLSA